MLQIRPIKKYTVARYPKGAYYAKPDPAIITLSKGAMVAAVMTMLFEACDGGGTTGPPPLPPTLVTETEARAVIDSVFADNGISLVSDFMLRFEKAPGDTIDLELDGYNDSLQVGYEYIYDTDYSVFTPEVKAALDSAAVQNGPYIEAIDQMEKVDNYRTILEGMVQSFIDSLKAQGAI
jgi:hypothetical protein